MSATLSVSILNADGTALDAASMLSKIQRVETLTNVGPNFPIMGYNPSPGSGLAKIAKDLTISGDLHVVEAFKELFARLDIDWQADLAALTGDAAAYKIGKTLKQAGQFFKHASKSFAQNSKEYLEHEAELLPSRLQFTDFSQDVRELNRDIDRVAAKIKRIQQATE